MIRNKKKSMVSRRLALLGLAAMLALGVTACKKEEKDEDTMTYTSIAMSEAAQRLEKEDGYILLDVRTVSEYDGGHIPGAICIPNETIGETEIAELPDKDQLLFVYCRSGNRSKQAAEKLVALGYTNVVEIGGIIDWTGETES